MNSDKNEFLKLFKELGAIQKGHFVYPSGRHGAQCIKKEALFERPAEIFRLAREIAARFKDSRVQTVIGAGINGAIIASYTAWHLDEYTNRTTNISHMVYFAYADKTFDKNFIIKRNFQKLIEVRRVLIINDVINTGESINKMIKAVRAINSDVIGAATLWNSGTSTKESLGIPRLEAIVSLPLFSWDNDKCKLCAKKIPINTDLGYGKDFLLSKH